ncbi:MAG: arsenic efflux protein, partial [Coriobacteriales bacterium]|nr:arsenic efflux protein [Coriobacteriales bacterium]
MFLDALLDALFDSAKLFPFLYLTYLFMEWIEHAAGDKFVDKLKGANKVGPLIGSVLGLIPQCGFSGASATLYAPRVISVGTLIAVFLATSDEMLPLMLS